MASGSALKPKPQILAVKLTNKQGAVFDEDKAPCHQGGWSRIAAVPTRAALTLNPKP